MATRSGDSSFREEANIPAFLWRLTWFCGVQDLHLTGCGIKGFECRSSTAEKWITAMMARVSGFDFNVSLKTEILMPVVNRYSKKSEVGGALGIFHAELHSLLNYLELRNCDLSQREKGAYAMLSSS